jgi:hypothetical protein
MYFFIFSQPTKTCTRNKVLSIVFFRSLFQLPHSAKLVDEDPIVDDEEIDTNLNNVDDGPHHNGHAGVDGGSSVLGNHDNDEFGVIISKTYPSGELKKWRKSPTVLENRGKPGELGEFCIFIFFLLNII